MISFVLYLVLVFITFINIYNINSPETHIQRSLKTHMTCRTRSITIKFYRISYPPMKHLSNGNAANVCPVNELRNAPTACTKTTVPVIEQFLFV